MSPFELIDVAKEVVGFVGSVASLIAAIYAAEQIKQARAEARKRSSTADNHSARERR